jgi:hypothetical protein
MARAGRANAEAGPLARVKMEELASGPKGAVEWIGNRWNDAVNVSLVFP